MLIDAATAPLARNFLTAPSKAISRCAVNDLRFPFRKQRRLHNFRFRRDESRFARNREVATVPSERRTVKVADLSLSGGLREAPFPRRLKTEFRAGA
ncbi:MAG TPA: hypothetical protein VHY35_08390 [Stellaceae bacterium]|nr:hypothetical protein [Stellaceae bacterium]